MSVDMSTPQARAAQQFMNHKGLGQYKPLEIEAVEDQMCWYFYYQLPEGDLELEVSWEHPEGWEVLVTTFTLAS